MAIQVGDKIPSAQLIHQTGETVTQVDIADLVAGKRAIIFGLPGAYTSTCSAAHLPSFIRTSDAFRGKGVDEIICISVNDVRVMEHWGRTSGAEDAGITMLADWQSEFTKAIGLEFSNPDVGFINRLTRCAMLVEDGEVKILHLEEEKGVCDLTAGETLLDEI